MQLRWRELIGGREVGGRTPNAPNWSLAGRTDEPVSGRGDAVGAVVQRGSTALRDHSIETRVRRRKRELTPVLQNVFRNYARGGMLVVAAVEAFPVGEMEAYAFRYMQPTAGVYAQPQHAVGRWRHRPRLESPRRGGRMMFRFFWVTRA